MSLDNEVATMIVEHLATQLAIFPEQALVDGHASLTITAGIKAARDAFHAHVTENELQELKDRIEKDVYDGLAALDAQRGDKR